MLLNKKFAMHLIGTAHFFATLLYYHLFMNNIPFKKGYFLPLLSVKSCELLVWSHWSHILWLIHSNFCFIPIVMNIGKVNCPWSCMIPITKLYFLATSQGEIIFQCICSGTYASSQLSNPPLIWMCVWSHWHNCHPVMIHRSHLNLGQIFTAAVANYTKMLYHVHNIYRKSSLQPFPHYFWHAHTGRFSVIWVWQPVHHKITLCPPILHKRGNWLLQIHYSFIQATIIWFFPCWSWRGRWPIPLLL